MKKTKNQLAYEREVRRLTRFIKSAEKQGIIFIPGEEALPQSPARITQKRLRELQLMTRSDVLSKGYTVDTETGEITQYKPKPSKKRYLSLIKPILTPTQAKKKRQEASRKGYETRKINEIMRKYKLPESTRDYIRKVLESDYTEAEKLDFIHLSDGASFLSVRRGRQCSANNSDRKGLMPKAEVIKATDRK